jgi:hypothetical protein
MASPSYTYTPNVPQANQKLSATQAPISNNFQAISDFLSVNHYGFNDTNYGKHSYTSLPFQDTDPDTLNGEMALYCKETVDGPNEAEIFARYPNNGDIIQITGGLGTGVSASIGFTYMSETVFIMWGIASGIVSSSINTITFPTGGDFPTIATAYTVYFTPVGSFTNITGSVPYAISLTATGFDLVVTGSDFATSIYWMVLGEV